MKKLPLKTLALLALGACLYAQQWPPTSTSYNGPSDKNYWTGTSHANHARSATLLGGLAQYADAPMSPSL